MKHEELKQLIEKSLDEFKQMFESRFNAQQHQLNQILQELTRIKTFLGSLPLDTVSPGIKTQYRESTISSAKNRVDLIQSPSDNDGTPSEPSDLPLEDHESIEEITAYLHQARSSLPKSTIQTQNKVFKSILRLEKQCLSEFQIQDWSNYFYNAYLLYDAILSYLLSFTKQKGDIRKSLKERWTSIKDFSIPFDLEVLIFLDSLYKEGGQIGAKEKTAIKIQDSLSVTLTPFKLIFSTFH